MTVSALRITDEKWPSAFLTISDETGRTLLALDRGTDGRLEAQYEPADLDEAARIFAEKLVAVVNAPSAPTQR